MDCTIICGLGSDSPSIRIITKNHEQKKEGVIDMGEKLPIEVQVFSYFAYKKYTEVSIGI